MAKKPKNRIPDVAEGMEPAVTPPPAGSETAFIKKPKISGSPSRKKNIPEGVWTKCPKCANLIFDKELDLNLKVCPTCEYHFPISARERIHALVARFTALLSAGVGAGELRPVCAADAVQTLIGATVYHFTSGEFGEAVLGGALFSAEAVARRKREVKELLLHGLQARSAPKERPPS